MSPKKNSAVPSVGGPGASHAGRKRLQKPKPDGELSPRQVKFNNAQRREQTKRANPDNINQQGNRANVRQNTTRQGNRRSA